MNARIVSSPQDALALRAEVAQLRVALSHRAVIDQAKGMLMARYGVDEARAFSMLRRWSSEWNVKVRCLALAITSETVVEPGEVRFAVLSLVGPAPSGGDPGPMSSPG